MAEHIITLLMRLQDADAAHVVIVTLPEVTPVEPGRSPCRRTCAAPTSSPGHGSSTKRGRHGRFDPLLQARLAVERAS